MAKNKPQKKSANKSGFWIVVVVIVLVVIITLLMNRGPSGPSAASVDAFAQCLTEKGTVMYGAFWCPHCARTKKMFGSSFRYIEYVECDPRGENEQAELCIAKEIDKYDTWEFADGSRVISEPSFQTLADKSGCPAPQ